MNFYSDLLHLGILWIFRCKIYQLFPSYSNFDIGIFHRPKYFWVSLIFRRKRHQIFAQFYQAHSAHPYFARIFYTWEPQPVVHDSASKYFSLRIAVGLSSSMDPNFFAFARVGRAITHLVQISFSFTPVFFYYFLFFLNLAAFSKGKFIL